MLLGRPQVGIGCHPGASFDPNHIAGVTCKLVLDARAGVNGGAPSSGDLTSIWSDQFGGSGGVTGAGASRPVWVANLLNGKPGVVFNTAAATKLLGAASLVAPGAARTVFIVGSTTVANGGSPFTFRVSGATYYCFQTLSGTPYFAGDSATNTVTTLAPQISKPHVAMWTQGAMPAAPKIRYDRKAFMSTDGSVLSNVDSGGAGFCLGQNPNYPPSAYDGPIHAVRIYDGVLAAADQDRVFDVLGADWGLTTCMALGDSITWGFLQSSGVATNGGWRQQVFATSKVKSIGTLVDAVGQFEGHSGFALGHGNINNGAAVGYLVDGISAWYAANPASVVIIEAGSNDVYFGGTTTGAAFLADLKAVIDAILTIRADATIVVMQPIGWASTLPAYNAIAASMRASLTGAFPYRGATLISNPAMVDADYGADGIHPNATGYGKMATSWIAGLAALGY